MRAAVQAYPEIIFIDGTYKLMSNGFVLILLLVEDSNGGTQIGACAVVGEETADIYTWTLKCFKSENKSLSVSVKCFMGDKLQAQRKAIKELFPGKPVYICYYHTMEIFKREVSFKNMNINATDRKLALDMLKKLACSATEASYMQTYAEFKAKCPLVVTRYYDDNWHKLTDEWCVFKMNDGNFGNITNNRTESMNRAIKQIVQKNSPLGQFFKDFFIFVKFKQMNHVQIMADNFLKRTNANLAEDEESYRSLLTAAGFKLVQSELRSSSKVVIQQKDCSKRICIVKYFSTFIETSTKSCECSWVKSNMLPCRHIFSTRNAFGLPFYSKELCADRWTNTYYIGNRQDNLQETSDIPSITMYHSTSKNTSSSIKIKMHSIFNKLTDIASASVDSNFAQKLSLLNKVLQHWKTDFTIVEQKSAPPHQNEVYLRNKTTGKITKKNIKSLELGDRRIVISSLCEKIMATNVFENAKLNEIQKLERAWRRNNNFFNVILKKKKVKTNSPQKALKVLSLNKIKTPQAIVIRGHPKHGLRTNISSRK
ncbi:unnamed protein product [Ceratitis capitata]|nr:unnamed protein product [Ceratitis capitata]